MNTLKFLVAAVALTCAFAVSGAGEVPLCNPGDTHSPPCPSAQTISEDPALNLGEAPIPREVQTVEIVSLVERALRALLQA